MRELTARIRFTVPSLGYVCERPNYSAQEVRNKPAERYSLLRTDKGYVMFLATWHRANMQLAAKLMGRYQKDVDQILWDVAVEGTLPKELPPDRWYRRHCSDGNHQRFVMHEALLQGQIVSINCVVPDAITDENFKQLLSIAGQYKGLSQYRPGEFGHFVVESVRPRKAVAHVTEDR